MADQALLMGAGLCALGLTGSAMCSGLETGFYSVNRIRLRVRMGKGDERAAAVHAELQQPDRLITALLIWNNIFNYLGSLGLTMILLGLGAAEGWVIVLQAAVLTPMLLVFGESLPKEIFRVRSDVLPYRLVWVVVLFRISALPVLWVVLKFARAVARLAGAEARTVSDRRYRIASLLKEGAMHGAISPIQASLIDDALELARTPVGNLSVPIASLATVAFEHSDEQMRAAARRAGTEPVVVLHARGRVAALVDPFDIGLGRVNTSEPFRIEATLGARDALAQLAERGLRAAVVTRAGRDVGIVNTRRLVRPLLRSIRPGVAAE